VWKLADFDAATLVKTPGCYAFQIDGISFTEVAVFELVG
jgi:hypothetical protein